LPINFNNNFHWEKKNIKNNEKKNNYGLVCKSKKLLYKIILKLLWNYKTSFIWDIKMIVCIYYFWKINSLYKIKML